VQVRDSGRQRQIADGHERRAAEKETGSGRESLRSTALGSIFNRPLKNRSIPAKKIGLVGTFEFELT
jgi:hypothetical protein